MKKRILIPAAVLLCAAAFFLYVSDFYRADETARSALVSDEAVTVSEMDYGWFFDGPSDESALIFYPGGKVETEAYAPLLHLLAEQGMDVCLADMPFHLAVFGIGRADSVIREHSYDSWYIGGHSLGGAMAASWAADNEDRLSGVVLLAAYPTEKLDDSLIEVLLCGSEDTVVNKEKLKEGLGFAPETCIEHVIEGGNHAGFGNYGEQKGDGKALISPEEQQEEAVRVITSCLP